MRSPSTLVVILAVVLVEVPASYGQAGSGELTGEVRDPTGAVVASARVILTSTATNETYESATGTGGVYVFSSQKPGFYNLDVEANGFKHFTQEGLNIVTGDRVRVDISLSIGSSSENITVHADAPLLRTDSATLGQVVDLRTIPTLPLKRTHLH